MSMALYKKGKAQKIPHGISDSRRNSNTYDRLIRGKVIDYTESSGKTADFEDSPRTWQMCM